MAGRTNYTRTGNLFYLFCDQSLQSRFFPNVLGVLTVNVPNNSEWLGGCTLDPYLDPISDIARTARAFKNLLISYEWVIFNRSGAA